MRKIADTIDGNILIEMSPAEWERLQRKPETTISEIEWDTLAEWQGEFLIGLRKLTINRRIFNV